MRILELRFKNLNSLYGEWHIDFTVPEYAANGIFALTGPTGAGKSTILDAICLALYGATPRLGKITKNSNEIMSRHTGECFAEVLFASRAGRFRCHFSQHRARKKAHGELQNPKHEIAEGDAGGRVIENRLRQVAAAVEEKTGMDFERFTRSMLLSQGAFDSFLKADAERKSNILEQITGATIYTEISRLVHERLKEEKEKLNLLQAEISGIMILDAEQEREIERELAEKLKQEKELEEKIVATGKAITWLTGIENLEKEIHDLADEAARLERESEAFRTERNRLDRALRAAALDGLYATLLAIRKQQAEDQAGLEACEKALPGLEEAASEQARSLETAERATRESKAELQAQAPLIKKIRLLDQKLAEQARTILEISESCRKDTAKIESDRRARAREKEKRAAAAEKLAAIERYLTEQARDEWLVGGLAGIEEQLGNLLARQEEIGQNQAALAQAEKALDEAAKKLADAAGRCAAGRRELTETVTRLQRSRESLSKLLGERLLREYRAEKEALQKEKEYLVRIAALEEHRAQLEDGKACPLCGSTEHPYATGNVPVPDEIEQRIESLDKLIAGAEELESAIKQLEESRADALRKLNESEKREAAAASDRQAAEKTLARLRDDLAKLKAGSGELEQAVLRKLQPLGITEIPGGRASARLASLRSRRQAWQEKVREKSGLEKQLAAIDSEIKRLDAVLETQVSGLNEKRRHLERLEKERSATMAERRERYGDRKPDAEESRLNKALADAEEAEKRARELNTGLQQQLHTARTHRQTLQKRIRQRSPELEKAETDFTSALERAGFADEKQFSAARLRTEKREALSARARALDSARAELATRQKDRRARLAAERAKKITDQSLGELKSLAGKYEASLKDLRDAIAALRHRLSENAAAREREKEKRSACKIREKECQRWEKLHALIGSADGKRYRNFAQGLTFELMVSHANRQLQKMTDRYLLVRDEKQPLELNVIDSYQAGEIRSTRNLSGGESFIVSLALALGLSRMASRRVKVESLFLDEGFGTLDEETLETALETLAGLQQDGKLIGVISHVTALKERIATRIEVIPETGGRSRINGPGCKQRLETG